MRLRVSELDQFRYYRDGDMAPEELQARLRGESEPTRPMLAGTAWHAVLEHPPTERVEVIESQGFTFRVDADVMFPLPQIREIRADQTFDIDGTPVTLSGGCDGISGLMMGDHKLTGRPDLERYFRSFQWRCYLELFAAEAFMYWVWHVSEKDGIHVIRDMQSFVLWRYPEMRAEILAELRQFVEFARFFLPERFDDPLPGYDDLASDPIPGLDDLETAA